MEEFLNDYRQLFGEKFTNRVYYSFLGVSIAILFFYAFMAIPDVKEGFNYSFKKWIPEMGLYSDFIKLNFEAKHISIFAAFIAAFLGIAIPISLGVISHLDQKYNQGGISREFLMERINRSQYYTLLINIVFLVVTMYRYTIHSFFAALYTLFFLFTVINFIAYIKLINSYLIDAKSIIYKKSYEATNRYLNGD
jgi:hypothetical protein